MARTSVSPTQAVKSASVLTTGQGVALDPTNGHAVVGPSSAGHLLLDIDSTFAGAKTFTIKAGAHQDGALGDLVVSLNAQRAVVLISSARFFQLDGSVNVDVQAGATGTIRAIRIPY